MANFTTKTMKEIAEGTIAKYKALRQKYKDTTPLLEKAAVKSLSWAFAGAVASVWKSLVWVYKQCFPQTCSLPVLKLWGDLVGVEFIYGQSSQVELTLSDVTASTLTTGTVYKELTSGLVYKTTAQGNNDNGSIVVSAQCTTAGSAGNLPVGTLLTIANPLDGIPQTATITTIKTEGSEDEDVEHYRPRVLYKFKNKAQGGSVSDYFGWCLEVSGIDDALIYVLTEGIVTIYLVATGSGKNRTPSGAINPNPFPNWIDGQFVEFQGSGQFLAVAKSIEGSSDGMHDRRPVNAKVNLLPCNYTGYEVDIKGLTSETYNDQIKAALDAALDIKRPHIIALNYSEANAKINSNALVTITQNIIGSNTFSTFTLLNNEGVEINEESLGIGSLAYLKKLTINNNVVFNAESANVPGADDEPAENEEQTDDQ